MIENLFTDAQAALEEMRYLADDSGQSHVVVGVMQVMTYDEARERGLPVLEAYTPRGEG